MTTTELSEARRRELIEQGIRLGPWNYEIEVAPGLTTNEFREPPPGGYPESFGKVGFGRPRERFQQMLLNLFPDGLEGRSVLDCACNCGAHLFWAKELGAGRCLGFDIREHWLNQARFLVEHRPGPKDDMRFELADLYDLPSLELEPFDLTLFLGIFYHLPEPIRGLKIAADQTREALVVHTVTQDGWPDGLLVASEESRTILRSGVYGLNWFPTGPATMTRVLGWAGLGEARTDRWRRRAGQRPPRREELRMVAARGADTLRAYDSSRERGAEADPVQAVGRLVPEGAIVLLVSRGDEARAELGPRRVWHFPQGADGGWAGYYPADGAEAVAHVEELRSEGARYLLFPPEASWWLEHYRELAAHLEERHRLVSDERGCRLFELLGP
jgi:tRNA (mo5U34)-methyltransferase